MHRSTKNILVQAEHMFHAKKYNEAAKLYNIYSAFYQDKNYDPWIPNMIRCLCCCDNENHKDKIIKIVTIKHDLIDRMTGNNIYHILASVYADTEIYKRFFLHNSTKTKHGLIKKNKVGDTPIETAILHENIHYLVLAKSLCKMPRLEDIEKMENIWHYIYSRSEYAIDVLPIIMKKE